MPLTVLEGGGRCFGENGDSVGRDLYIFFCSLVSIDFRMCFVVILQALIIYYFGREYRAVVLEINLQASPYRK